MFLVVVGCECRMRVLLVVLLVVVVFALFVFLLFGGTLHEPGPSGVLVGFFLVYILVRWCPCLCFCLVPQLPGSLLV